MANDEGLLERSIRIHPVFLLGLTVLLVSLGAVFAETLFAGVTAVTGLSVLAAATVWVILSLITIVLGLWRSFEVIGDAR